METRLFISDIRPAVAEAKNIGGYCWLDIKQGDDTISLMLPFRMMACAAMIADAFNSHMKGDELTKRAQGENPVDVMDRHHGIPAGGALSAEGALAIAATLSTDGYATKVEFQGTEPFMTASGMEISDRDAAHAVERRDLP